MSHSHSPPHQFHNPGNWKPLPRYNGMALASLIVGIVSILFCAGPGFFISLATPDWPMQKLLLLLAAFLPGLIALLLGLFAALAIVLSFGKQSGLPSAIVGMLLGATFPAVAGYMFLTHTPPVETVEVKLAKKLEVWRKQETGLESTIRNLLAERFKLIDEIKAEGVLTSEDLAGNEPARAKARELLLIERQIKAAEQKKAGLKEAVAKLDSTISRLRRERELEALGVTEEHWKDVEREVVEFDVKLEQELGPAIDLELDDVVNKALHGQ